MPDTAPLTQTLQARVAAVAAGSDATENVAEAPFAGTVTGASYTPDATITGAATNNRTISIVNKAQDGTGTTVVATLSFGNGTNIAGSDEGALTLSVVAGATTVAAGDELAFVSTHVGTGIADPGGLVQVQVTRS
jgi:hypothetical protein